MRRSMADLMHWCRRSVSTDRHVILFPLIFALSSTFWIVQAASPSPPIVAVSVAPLGVHPTSGVDFSSTNVNVFLDLMQHSSEFSVEWGLSEDGGQTYKTFGTEYNSAYHPTFDADGYPLGLQNESDFNRDKIMTVAATIGEGGANLPAGEYVCLFEGDGVVALDGDAVALPTAGSHVQTAPADNVSLPLETSTGRLVFQIRPAHGLKIRILRSSLSNPVTLIRLVPLDFEEAVRAGNASAFHPDFLERLAPFNTIIFHGWFGIDDNDYNPNNLAGRSWTDRPRIAQQTQRGSKRLPYGVALDHIVNLCNEVEADAWLTLPDLADESDDYANNAAAFVAQRLGSDLRVLLQHRWTKSFGNFDRQQQQSELLFRIWTNAMHSTWQTREADGGRFHGPADRLVFVVAGDYYSHTAAAWPLWFDPRGNSTVVMTTPRLELAGAQPRDSFDSWEGGFTYANASDAELVAAVRNAELYAEEQMVPLLGYLGFLRDNYNDTLQHTVTAVATFDDGLRAAGYGWRWSLSYAKQCRLAFQERLGFAESYETTFAKWTANDPDLSTYYEQKQFNCANAMPVTEDVAASISNIAIGEGADLRDAPVCAGLCSRMNATECGGFYLPPGKSNRSCTFLSDPHTNIQSYAQEGGNFAPPEGVGSCFVRPEWFVDAVVRGGLGEDELASATEMQALYDSTHGCISWTSSGLRRVSEEARADGLYGTLVNSGQEPFEWNIQQLEQYWLDIVGMDRLEAELEARLVALGGSWLVGHDLALDLLRRWSRLPGSGGVVANLFDVGPVHTCPTGGKDCGITGLVRPRAANATEEVFFSTDSSGSPSSSSASVTDLSQIFSSVRGGNASRLTPDEIEADRDAWHETVSYYSDNEGLDWDSPLWKALTDFATDPSAPLKAISETGTAPSNFPVTSDDVVPRIVAGCNNSCTVRQGICINGTCTCFRGFSGSTCANIDLADSQGGRCDTQNVSARLGVGLSGLNYYSTGIVLTDVYRVMGDWVEQYHYGNSVWDENFDVDFDVHGYPRQLGTNEKIQSLVMRDLEQIGTVNGKFVIRWDGDGILSCAGLDVASDGVVRARTDELAGYMECDVVFTSELNNGLLVTILFTNPADPVRNIRAFLPGFDEGEWAAAETDEVATQSTYNTTDKEGRLRQHGVVTHGQLLHGPLPALPFHPHFLQFLEPFGHLRFMDWMHANEEGQPDPNWNGRPDFRNRVVTGPGGIPLEYIVLTANLLGKDLWINTPVEATTNYYTGLAHLLARELRPDVEVVIEVGNELWHTGFFGGDYAALEATRRGLPSRHCWAVEATRNASATMRGVFSDLQAESSVTKLPRLQFFLSTQLSNVDVTRHILEDCDFGPMPTKAPDSEWNRSARKEGLAGGIDAIGPAIYFGPAMENVAASTEAVLDQLWELMPSTIVSAAEHAALIRNRSNGTLRVLAYECGPAGLSTGASDDLVIAAHRSPRMRNLTATFYRHVLQTMDKALHFGTIGEYSQYGSWSLLEGSTQNPQTAPKYQGILDVVWEDAASHTSRELSCSVDDIRRVNRFIDMCTAETRGTCGSGNGWCLDGTAATCLCFTGFEGEDCSVVHYVDEFDCGYKCSFDRGACRVAHTEPPSFRLYGCDCSDGYFGRTCARATCEGNCSWNGDCLDVDICSCYPGFTGDECQIDCGCHGHGQCHPAVLIGEANLGDVPCICDDGWEWSSDQATCVWSCDCGHSALTTDCVGPGVCGCGDRGCSEQGTCVNGACQCWAGFSGQTCEFFDAARRPNYNSPVGMNVGEVGYGLESIFVDVMKHSSYLTSINAADLGDEESQYVWGNGEPIWQHDGDINSSAAIAVAPDTLGKGYPVRLNSRRQNLVALTLRDLCHHGTNGVYTVLFDGNGTLSFEGMDAMIVSRRKGRVDVRVELSCDPACWFDRAGWLPYCTDNGVAITWEAIDVKDPPRNIRILLPGEYYAKSYLQQPFHPVFLKDMSRFQTLRFMDFHSTNGWPVNSTPVWKRRTLPSDRTQVNHDSGGTAFEYSLLLTNTIGANAWYCVPHAADDAYVRAMATMVLTELDKRSDTKVFVEYSNEVWNTLFPAGQYATIRGAPLAATGGCKLYGDQCNRARWNAQRSKEISQVWHETAHQLFDLGKVTSDWGKEGRLKVVLGTWTYAGKSWVEEMLSWNDTARWVDYIGVTGYLSATPEIDSSWATYSVEQVLATLESTVEQYRDAGIDNDNIGNSLAEIFAFVTTSDVALHNTSGDSVQRVDVITYEAGPGLVEPGVIEGGSANGHITELLVATARDDGMAAVYTDFLEVMSTKYGLANATRPFMAFSSTGAYSKYGTWGHQEFTGQGHDAPKWKALQDFISQNQHADVDVDVDRTDDSVCVNSNGVLEYSPSRWNGEPAYVPASFVGAPAVLEPTVNTVWVVDGNYDIEWDSTGMNSRSRVHLYLWDGPSCNGGSKVATVGLYVPQTGKLAGGFRVPRFLQPGRTYMLEVVGEGGSNFSSFFSVVSKYQVSTSAWSPCSASCGSTTGMRNRTSECTERDARLAHAEGQYAPVFNPAMSGQSRDCTDSLGGKAEAFYNYNQWLDRWDYGWVDGFLAGWWVIESNFTLSGCEYVEQTECREYRTHRVSDDTVARLQASNNGVKYANFFPVIDCVSRPSVSVRTEYTPVPRLRQANMSECADVVDISVVEECIPTLLNCTQQLVWEVGDFGPCDQSCGPSSGTRSRTVQCRRVDLSAGTTIDAWPVVDDAQCLLALADPRPSEEESCNDIRCVTYTIRYSNFGDCSFACIGAGVGGYTQSRTWQCVSSEGVVAAASLCEIETEPSRSDLVRACDPDYTATDAANGWSWTTTAWSACSVTCGGGTRSRKVTCESCLGVVSEVNGSSPCEMHSGLAASQPKSSEVCNTFDCAPSVGWKALEWSSCMLANFSAYCESAIQRREVLCYDYSAKRAIEYDDWSLCGNVSNAPVQERTCSPSATAMLQGCTHLCMPSTGNTTTPCSGHGTCGARACLCETGFAGPYCQINLAACASGVQNIRGKCCSSGLSDEFGECCEDAVQSAASGSMFVLDSTGTCCEGDASMLDACGVCGGSAIAIAKDGACCTTALSPDGTCCWSGSFDGCGMCDGDGSSCAVEGAVSIESSDISAACAAGLFDSDCADVVDAFIDDVCANVTAASNRLNCTVKDVRSTNAGSPSQQRQRLLGVSGGISLTVEVVAFGAGIDYTLSTPLCISGSDCQVSVDSSLGGYCGDGVCQGGETCYDHPSIDCCVEDCGLVLQRCANCPANRGTCHPATAECICFKGYAGDACDECIVGWDQTTAADQCVAQWDTMTDPSLSPLPTTNGHTADTTTSQLNPNSIDQEGLPAEVVGGISAAVVAAVLVAVVAAVVAVNAKRKQTVSSAKVQPQDNDTPISSKSGSAEPAKTQSAPEVPVGI